MTDKIKYSQSLLRSMMESPENLLIWAVDREYNYLFFNNPHKEKMKQFWGVDIELGQPVFSYIPDQDYVSEVRQHYERLLNGVARMAQDELVDEAGQVRYFDNYGNPIYDDEKNIIGLVLYAMEVTDRVRAVKELEVLSVTDRLTGLFNRGRIEETLAREISRAERYHHPFSLLILDIDHFKLVNDRFGHCVGDEVLVLLAKILSSTLREVDVCGRWGGEEFIIILPETELRGALLIAEKLRQSIEKTAFPHGETVTCSIGAAEYMRKETPEYLIHRTDAVLYKAKERGRNRVEADPVSP